MLKKVLRVVSLLVAALLILIQLIPYGHDHSNPPVRQEPNWDSPETRALAKRGCFDCHSNETVWPWYSYVAPASWLVQRDVEGGRHHLNFSEWDVPQDDAKEAAEMVRKGEMPLWFYVPLHTQANLNGAEKKTLIDGLERTFGGAENEAREKSEEH